MAQNIIAQTIGWKLATVLAVVGGGLALGGSFYVGKQVGSSGPPTVIRLPPRMLPMPVPMDPTEITSQDGDDSSSQASPPDVPVQPRPNRLKRIPVPGSVEKRSLGPDAKKSGTDKT
jgi:hypothetical protein